MKNVQSIEHSTDLQLSISTVEWCHTLRLTSLRSTKHSLHKGRSYVCPEICMHGSVCKRWKHRVSSEVNTIQMPRGAARNTEPTDMASELTTVPRPLWFLGWRAFPVPLQCICPTTNSRVDSRYKLCQAPTHLFTTNPKMTTQISCHQMATENLVEKSSPCRLRVSFPCRPIWL